MFVANWFHKIRNLQYIGKAKTSEQYEFFYLYLGNVTATDEDTNMECTTQYKCKKNKEHCNESNHAIDDACEFHGGAG